MAMKAEDALALAKSYTKKSLSGAGGLKGDPGVGIATVTQTTTSTDSGGENIITVTKTDGTSSTFSVWNGAQGAEGPQGVAGPQGVVGPQGPVGPQGETGASGAQGLQGPTGPQGEQGEIGPAGADGFSPTLAENADNAEDVYKLDVTDKNGTFTTPNLVGKQGPQGQQGPQGVQGPQGLQGIQGPAGERGADGYPFLIYKEYASIDEFNAADFPEIGLMFMVNDGVAGTDKPVYRYTGETDTPYSHITDMATSEGLKGETGAQGPQGEQGVPGVAGVDGITYTPVIGTVQTVTAVQDATAEVVVDSTAKTATFNFSIPRGAVGQQGLQGEKGETGADGAKGADGTTYTPAIGTIETVDSNLAATANVAIDTETKQAVFNFAIPRGVGISSVVFTSTTDASGEAGKAGATDTYTITYTDGKTSEYKVYNGAEGAVIDDLSVSETSVWSSSKVGDTLPLATGLRNVDLNDITANGTYTIGVPSSIENIPDTRGYGILSVFKGEKDIANSGYALQVYVLLYDNTVYLRGRIETGAWKPWVKLTTNAEINKSEVFSNGVLNINTLCTTYGNGRYVLVGQGSAGNASVTLDAWTLASGSTCYVVQQMTSGKTATTFVGYTHLTPTVDLGTDCFGTCNYIEKVCGF